MNRKLRIVSALLLMVCLASCQHNVPAQTPVAVVARGLNDLAHSMEVFQGAVSQASASNLIDINTARDLMNISVQINQAGSIATQATRDIAQLSPNDKTRLLSTIQPLVKTISTALGQGLIGVKDTNTRNTFKLLLSGAQAYLNTVILTLSQ